MVIFLYGPDTYRSRQKLQAIEKRFKDKKGFDTCRLEGADLTTDEFRKASLTSGLFSKKRLIVIENLLSINPSSQEDVVLEIIDFLKKPKGNIVVFWDAEIDGKKLTKSKYNLYQLLKREKYIQHFELLKPYRIKLWIRAEAVHSGLRLENSATSYLTRLFGANLWLIKNELNKLSAYSRKMITEETVKTLTSPHLNENIWDLVDAIGHKEKSRSLRLLSDQVKSGQSIDWIISMLSREFRLILKVKLFPENKKSTFQLVKALRLPSFVCEKLLAQEKNFNLGQLKKIYHELVRIDFLRKTTNIKPEVLLDLLIVKS